MKRHVMRLNLHRNGRGTRKSSEWFYHIRNGYNLKYSSTDMVKSRLWQVSFRWTVMIFLRKPIRVTEKKKLCRYYEKKPRYVVIMKKKNIMSLLRNNDLLSHNNDIAIS